MLEVRAIAVALSAYCVRIFDLCVHLKVVWESGTSLQELVWKLLSGNELQIERLSLFFKPFDALEPELFFVMFDTLFDIVLSVTQHAID